MLREAQGTFFFNGTFPFGMHRSIIESRASPKYCTPHLCFCHQVPIDVIDHFRCPYKVCLKYFQICLWTLLVLVTVSEMPLWSEFMSGGNTEKPSSSSTLDTRARSINVALPLEATLVGSCTTWQRLRLDSRLSSSQKAELVVSNIKITYQQNKEGGRVCRTKVSLESTWQTLSWGLYKTPIQNLFTYKCEILCIVTQRNSKLSGPDKIVEKYLQS